MARIEVTLGHEQVGAREGEDRIYISAPFALREVCAGLTGRRWKPTTKQWHVPATTGAAAEITRKFTGMSISMDAATQELFRKAATTLSAQDSKHARDLPNPPVRTDAWLHQRRAFAFAKDLDAAMLAMEMGTGKSLVEVALTHHFDARLVLIACPVSVVGVWPKQWNAHALDPEQWDVVAPLPGKVPIRRRAQILADGIVRAGVRRKKCVVVVNYESAWRGDMAILLKSIAWDDVILDESHRAKAPGGKASMFLNALRKRTKRAGAATGTPMPHSPKDIYAQYRFLDPAIFGTSVNRFMNRYAIQVAKETRQGQRYDQVEGWQNMEDFTEKFHSIAFVVTKEEALPDLPEKLQPTERTFELPPKALATYRAMAKDMVAGWDESGYIVSSNSLSKVMKLRRITSGHAQLDDGRVVKIHDERERLLGDVLEDVDEPTVVFAVFRDDLAAIARVAEKTGRRYGELSGSRRDGLASDATMRPDIDLLGCQLKSGGVGVDFSRSSLSVYYSIDYELGNYLQSTDRTHRPGQLRPCRYIHLLAENAPIDRVMYESLVQKKSIVDGITQAARERQLV